jgi:hypothetical protein
MISVWHLTTALASLVLEDPAVPELEPFRLDRFSGRRANK